MGSRGSLQNCEHRAQSLICGPYFPQMTPSREILMHILKVYLQRVDPTPFLAPWVLAGCLLTPY